MRANPSGDTEAGKELPATFRPPRETTVKQPPAPPHPGPRRRLTAPPHRATAHAPRPPPGGGLKTPIRFPDWFPLQGRPGISCRSGGRALPACWPAIGQRRRRAARPLAGGRVRSGAGGGCHWLESRLVVRRWVASQAESRSGTGAACAGRAARCRGTATPPPPTPGAARGRAELTVSR